MLFVIISLFITYYILLYLILVNTSCTAITKVLQVHQMYNNCKATHHFLSLKNYTNGCYTIYNLNYHIDIIL